MSERIYRNIPVDKGTTQDIRIRNNHIDSMIIKSGDKAIRRYDYFYDQDGRLQEMYLRHNPNLRYVINYLSIPYQSHNEQHGMIAISTLYLWDSNNNIWRPNPNISPTTERTMPNNLLFFIPFEPSTRINFEPMKDTGEVAGKTPSPILPWPAVFDSIVLPLKYIYTTQTYEPTDQRPFALSRKTTPRALEWKSLPEYPQNIIINSILHEPGPYIIRPPTQL